MCEAWLAAMTAPPVTGMFSPPTQSRFVNSKSSGFRIATQSVNAHPRRSCIRRGLPNASSSAVLVDVETRHYCPAAPGHRRWDLTPSLARSATMGARVVTQRFGVLLPLKPAASAKSRLGSLGEDARRELVAAFADDTMAAVQDCALVGSVLIVTDDAAVAQRMGVLGVDSIPDGASHLNDSLVQAAAELRRRSPLLRPVAVCGDLPALRADELAAALDEAPANAPAFVSDASGSGTTLYTAPDATRFRPRFGVGSRAAHLGDGS